MGIRTRLLARVYDRMLAGPEAAGLREMRAWLVGQAAGQTVEVGAGTGLNLHAYHPEVELIAAEPEAAMRARLVRRAARVRPSTRIEPWPAEALELPDASVDTVVATLVLCTVPALPGAIAEIRRVLRPGGRFLFIEHVLSPDTRVARVQRLLAPPWQFLSAGCHLDRYPVPLLQDAGFAVEARHARIPRAPRWVAEAVLGAATR